MRTAFLVSLFCIADSALIRATISSSLHATICFFIERRIDGVKILAVQVLLRDADSIGEALIVHNLALAQEFDGIAHVGIVTQSQNVVVGHACLLLCQNHVFATFWGVENCEKTYFIMAFDSF